MARFVRKPRPTPQHRRSHHGPEAAEAEPETEASGTEAPEEPDAETAFAAAAATDAEVEAASVAADAPDEPAAGTPAPADEPEGGIDVSVAAAEEEAAVSVTEQTGIDAEAASVAPVEAEAGPGVDDGGPDTDAGTGDDDDSDDGDAETGDSQRASDAGDSDTDDDDAEGAGTGERRTIKRRRRRRPAAASVGATGEGSGEAGEPAATGDEPPQARSQAKKEPAADDADRDERKRMQMLIHVEGDRVQVSVLEGRSLVEHYVADRTSQSLAGNIYLGKVQNVLPGMEAAFIDIGTPKNAVLYAGDVRFIADEFETKTPRIEEILEVGQSVLVQVVKDPMGSKGARLTTEISLPGRFLVLVPESDSTGISRRLAESERERLRDVLRRIRPDGFGVIVRTAAEYTSEDKLTLDMQRLESLWKEVYLEATRANPPELVYEEPDLVIRTVREIFSGEFRRLIVDDQEVYDKICEYLGDYEPDLLQRIQLYEDEMSLYRRYHVSEQLRQGLSRKVWLPSGGSLVFDSAEALTVIDVNTSKNVGKSSLEETVFQNNLEAAEEIGRQLRLRDIGGIIVIDFIDMETAKNRQAVLRAFREAVGRDKTKTQVYDISELGLVEMTRKNVSEGLISAFSHACSECSGRGLIVDEDF